MLTTCSSQAVYPEGLLAEAPEDLLDGERRWWVIYTKSRQEKALARDLYAQEIAFYLPLVRQTKLYQRRKVNTEIPIFTGYVFLFGTDEDRVDSLKTNRVSRVLSASDDWQLHRDLGQLQRLIESDAPLTIEQRLSPGNRVRVKCGPLTGLEGTITCRRGTSRLLIRVNFLQQGASIEIDDFVLEWIG